MTDPLVEKARAVELTRNEAFQGFVEATRADLVAEWKNAQTTAERETCWYKLQGLNALLKRLLIVTDRGKKLEKAAEQAADRQRRKASGADRDRRLTLDET